MAEILGPMQVVQQALPTGVDGTKVAEWRFRDGISFEAFMTQVGTAIGMKNLELLRMWGDAISIVETDVMEYPDGGSVTAMPLITDVDRPDMIHGQTIGHMIDLKPYGRAVGGSWRYFRDSRQAQILSTIQTVVRTGEWRFDQAVHTRAYTNTENAIGTGGYDVPFVRGTGGNVDFTPPAYGGEAFANTHDHFVFNNTGYAELLEDMVETLEEHGHPAPYVARVSRADVKSYRALAGFIEMVDPRVNTIDRAAATTGNEFFTTGTPDVANTGAFGFFQSSRGLIELRASQRVPTDYAFLYKSYGVNDARNPLAVRVHPEQGFGMFIVPSLSDETRYPVKRINIEFEFGVSVGQDRTNGVVGRQNSSWTNPTIS